MIPEGLNSYSTIYALCASIAIFFSMFAVGIFLGLAVYDIWACDKFTKSKKIIYTIVMFLLPEIGVFCWVFLLGKSKKLIFRIIAFCTSGLYLLLQTGMLFTGYDLGGIDHAFTNMVMMHCWWMPFTVIGGGISFFIFRSIFSDKPTKTKNKPGIS